MEMLTTLFHGVLASFDFGYDLRFIDSGDPTPAFESNTKSVCCCSLEKIHFGCSSGHGYNLDYLALWSLVSFCYRSK